MLNWYDLKSEGVRPQQALNPKQENILEFGAHCLKFRAWAIIVQFNSGLGTFSLCAKIPSIGVQPTTNSNAFMTEDVNPDA